MPLVPNLFPSLVDTAGRRLAVISESPSQDDELVGQPFSGSAGRLLRHVLSHANINPSSCFLGNISQHRIPADDSLDFNSHEVQSGLEVLHSDLQRFKPHCCLLLGRAAFRAFNPDRCYSVRPTKENPDGFRIPLSDWRGSPFISTPFSLKCIPTYSPAYVLRSISDIAYLRADVTRAVRHSSSPTLVLPQRIGILRPTLEEVTSFLSRLRTTRASAAFDIEGYSDCIGVTMLSIAPTPTFGIVIPFFVDGKNYWSEDEEPIVWRELAGYLADPDCPKIAHNAFYETAVLGWRHQIVVNNLSGDTMMKHWEMYNELEKSLAVCTSLWIEEPYYKDERDSSGDTKLNYNFKDSACTKGIDEVIDKHLTGRPREHYEFNTSLIPAYTYIHLRGCRFSSSTAAHHRQLAEAELNTLLISIDKITFPALGHAFNPKSINDKKWLLYTFLDHTPYKRYGDSTKEEILQRFYKKRPDEVLRLVIRAVNLRTRISDIEKLNTHSDGRIRTAYDLVSTVTARLNSRESSLVEQVGTNTKGKVVYAEFGTNLQNVTKGIRDCFVTDSDDFYFWQADLEGADAWTVAADLAALGFPTMLEDLQARVKPSKLLLAMLNEIEAGRDPAVIARLSSLEAKKVCDSIIVPEGMLPDGRPADWQYVSMKRVQHGTNYLGQAETISALIFKDSDGVIDVPPIQVDRYQRLYLLRYNIHARRDWITSQLSTKGYLDTAAGCRRKFFGIRNPRQIDDDIIRQAMASEPQTNTTYCTNLALKNLWYDPLNRRRTGALFIEPLLQIHDALAGQFPTRLRDFARERIRTYFSNPITIHGVKLTIPVDIKIGRSWGGCKEAI